MGREVRRVIAGWNHPKDESGEYIPLFEGREYAPRVAEWDIGASKWAEGLRDDWNGGWKPLEDDEKDISFEKWSGERPKKEDYMPEWPEELLTHIMMYEDTSEGTPISPAFDTPEELAKWLVDNNASAFGGMTATYEQWLNVCQGAFAPSAVIEIGDGGGVIRSGVEFVAPR